MTKTNLTKASLLENLKARLAEAAMDVTNGEISEREYVEVRAILQGQEQALMAKSF